MLVTRTAPAFTTARTVVTLGALLALATSCKKPEAPSCVPEDEAAFKVRVLVQPTDLINPDETGRPLATLLRLYQLSSDDAVPLLDFRETWQKGKEVFGD